MLVLFFTVMVARAETAAVKELNYSIGASYISYDQDIGDSVRFAGEFRAPVFDYTAISIVAAKSKFNAKGNSVDSDDSEIEFGLIFRKPDLGLIELRTSNDSSKHTSRSDNHEIKSTSNSIIAAYYLNKFDIAFLRTETSVDVSGTNIKSNFNSYRAGYFINDNFKVDLYISKIDNVDFESRLINASFQPSFFNKSVSASLGYASSESAGFSIKAYLFSIQYHFDTKVSLFERERYY